MLNDIQIQTQCERDGLIHPYSYHQLNPHSYDCKLGSNFKVPSKMAPGVFVNIDIVDQGYFILPSLSFALAHTVEVVNIPLGIVAFVVGKSTIARNGLTIEQAGLLDAGFSGQVTLELFNSTPWELKLKPGMLICQAIFHNADEPCIKSYTKIGSYCNQRGATPPVYTLSDSR